MITFVIPLHHAGGKFKNNTELRYALRSLEKHCVDPFEVVIVGKKLPDWLVGVKHLPSSKGLKTALVDASNAYPGGFVWWYDDCCLLQDQNLGQLKVTPATKGWQKPQTKWSTSLDNIKTRLIEEGHVARDYSRPHGPYWFDKSMVEEAFADWPKMSGKFPWESWILSKRGWPCRHGVVKQYYGAFRQAPGEHSVFLNYCDNGLTPELRAWLDGKFPEPSKFERVKKETKTPARVLFTCHEGCNPLVWEWCGPGIKHFAKTREAKLIELPKCKDLNPQWVIFDAFKDSLKYGEGEFAWMDSDIVVADNATDFWGMYPNALHLCVNDRKDVWFHDAYGIPHYVVNNCTGIVKWNRNEAIALSEWYEANKHRFPKKAGDQELLMLALWDLRMKCKWFHHKMHVAGARPPAFTAFKHKGGKSKIRWIPQFLESNRKHGIDPILNQK